jgi:uncharacterized protein YabN with tetrapyrrole methylase and pyrophosphatase domain
MNVITKVANIDKKARGFGFEWPNAHMIIDSVQSECAEVREVIEKKESRERLQEEIGDLLFSAFSLCFFENLDPEVTLNKATDKFTTRFAAVQRIAKQKGLNSLHDQPFSVLISLWNQAKEETKVAH